MGGEREGGGGGCRIPIFQLFMLMHVASVSTLNAQPRKVSLMCFIGANEALWPVQLSFHETMGA